MQISLQGIKRGNLSMNPFDCDPCPLLYLHIWLQKQSAESPNLHFCSHPSNLVGKVALELPFSPQACLLRTTNVTLVITMVFLFATAALGSFAYYRRWNILYFSVRLRSFILGYRRINIYSDIKDYTAFVSYGDADKKWIVTEMLPELERGENSLRLFIRDRDCIPGENKLKNIIDNMENSKKVILILSEAFVSTNWCIFEMQIAYQKFLEKTIDGLVLVKVGSDVLHSNNDLLNYLMKTRTYLEWPSAKEAKPLFWERLRKFLNSTNQTELFNRLV